MNISPAERLVVTQMCTDVGRTSSFMEDYEQSRKSGNTRVAAFDSVHGGDTNSVKLPSSLSYIFSLPTFDSAEAQEAIMKGLDEGIRVYKLNNGGEMPHPSLITAAFDGAAQMLREPEFQQMFDSFSVESSESLSVVPALASVTIATRISSGLPFISQLPNPTGSNEVPFVIATVTADAPFGGLALGDRLDGSKATLNYVRNKRLFLATQVGSTNEYTVTPHVAYLDPVAFTPDTSSPVAVFVGGRVTIRVNGMAVANDAVSNHVQKAGVSNLTSLNETVAGQLIGITSATASLDTGLIDVTFSAALPAGAVVHAEVVFDYERKDANKNPVLAPPSADVTVKKQTLRAFPSRAQTYIDIDAQTQMQNEMNLSPQGLMMQQFQQKYYLEDNIALLSLIAMQARYAGRVLQFDYSRQSTVTAGFNSQADGIAYVMPTIDLASMYIRNLTLDSSMVDVLMGDHASVFFRAMGELYNIDPVVGCVPSNGAITRIATWKDGRNMYHVPTAGGVLPETATSATIMVLARGSQPQFNPLVGMTAVPPMLIDLQNKAFERGVGYYARNASDVNPHGNYAQGVYLIDMINLPSLAS
jgi:hypothetical protein